MSRSKIRWAVALATVPAAFVALAAFTGGAGAAPPSSLCVGGKPGCFASIQAALDAAQDGDTISIGPGTFAGGITIDKSIELVGVSAEATTIEGGGPVIRIGDPLAPDPPTVSISRVTITGGLNDSRPESQFGEGFFTAGGGVLIPAAAGDSTGATVTITDSVVTGNRVTAGAPQPLCGVPCSFASGGGIGNWGTLTVTNTRIDGNVVGATPTSGSQATDARGGGIWNARQGTVTLRHSSVSNNRSAVSAPNGRFAEAGGIGDDGALVVEDSIIRGNSATAETDVASTFPFDVTTEAVAGGIRISDVPDSSATITRSVVTDNSVVAFNAGGDAQATSGGLDVDGTLLLVDSRVDRNTVQANVPSGSGFLAGAVFGGIEVSSLATIRSSSVSHNVMSATSALGAANVAGGGIGNLSGNVTLERALVIGNRGTAHGVGGLALGGGILSVEFGGGPPQLSVSDSVVSANMLTAASGVTPHGGGIFSADIFTLDPVAFSLSRTAIEGNKPDQCVGC